MADNYALRAERSLFNGKLLRLACFPLAILLTAEARATQPTCSLLPGIISEKAQKRPVAADDLIRIRDFGFTGFGQSFGPPATLSPAGDLIALQLRQADPKSNTYCVKIVVKGVRDGAPARIVADGGELKRVTYDKYGVSGLVAGPPTPSIIRWSPDGRSIAFTRVSAGINQIWEVDRDGALEKQVTRSPVDVEDFQWTPDGRSITFKSRPALIDAEAAIDRESYSGFRYDARFWPLVSGRPYPSRVSFSFSTVRIATGDVSPARDDEKLILERAGGPERPQGALSVAFTPDGSRVAWIAQADANAYRQPTHLHVKGVKDEVSCQDASCNNVFDLWWVDKSTLVFLRHEGVADGQTGLYRWRLGTQHPQEILSTSDIWFGCQKAVGELICADEGSTQPRRIIAINTSSGAVRTVYDPNPEFAAIKLSKAVRLTWHNSFGIETFGDLVLPEKRRSGEKLPLIVVQYDSRGFLRGGMGDEFPIQLFAEHGFAVLSFNRPPYYALSGPPHDLQGFLHANQEQWSDRRSILSSLEIGVQRLIDDGTVDERRIGITGQSDGATTAEFALVHSKLFSVVALSTCCDSAAMMATVGEGHEREYVGYGYPEYGERRDSFWEFGTLLPNLKNVRPVPVLIQAGDEEFRLALETFEGMRTAGWPVEMYVFPGEAHVKIQPSHRLAIYERNLAWFQHWLQNAPKEAEGIAPTMK